MSNNVGKINVLVGGNAEQFYSVLSNVEKRLNKLGKDMEKIGKKMATHITAPIMAAGAAALAASVNVGAYADTLLDLEEQTGLSTDELQRYRGVAVEAGVATDTVAKAAENLTKRLSKGSEGSAELQAGLSRLGVSLNDVSGNLRPMDDIMGDTLSKLADMDDSMQRNILANKIFGSSAKDLAPILSMGSAGIDQMKKKAEELGLVMSKDSLEAANEFRAEVDWLKKSFEGIANEIGIAFLPIAKELTAFMKDKVVPAIRGVVEWFKGLDDSTKRIIAVVGGLVAGIAPLMLALSGIISIAPAVGTAFTIMTGPIGLIVTAVAGAAALLFVYFDEIKVGVQLLALNFIAGAIKILESIEKLTAVIPSLQGKVSSAIDSLKGFGRGIQESITNTLNKGTEAAVEHSEAVEEVGVKASGTGTRIRRDLVSSIEYAKQVFDKSSISISKSLDKIGKSQIEASKSLARNNEEVIWGFEQYMQYFNQFENSKFVALEGILSIGDGIQNMFMEFARTGKLSFQSLLAPIQAFIGKLMGAVAAAALLSVLMKSTGLGAAFGIGSSFDFKSLLKQFSGGFLNLDGNMANGGQVNMGSAYVVGERGRELFVPTTQGTIIANNKMKEFSGGGSMNGEVSFRIKRDELVGILKQDQRFRDRF